VLYWHYSTIELSCSLLHGRSYDCDNCEDYWLLRCDALQIGTGVPTFYKNTVPSPSGYNDSATGQTYQALQLCVSFMQRIHKCVNRSRETQRSLTQGHWIQHVLFFLASRLRNFTLALVLGGLYAVKRSNNIRVEVLVASGARGRQ
jgi:hypothetical protein